MLFIVEFTNSQLSKVVSGPYEYLSTHFKIAYYNKLYHDTLTLKFVFDKFSKILYIICILKLLELVSLRLRLDIVFYNVLRPIRFIVPHFLYSVNGTYPIVRVHIPVPLIIIRHYKEIGKRTTNCNRINTHETN